MWFFEDFKFAYKTIKFYAKWLVRNFGQKHELQYLNYFAMLSQDFKFSYAVEQFNSLFSKDKLKQGTHIHQTHDPSSPCMSWENCCNALSQQFPHVLCGAGT